jgi:hypothetical protein
MTDNEFYAKCLEAGKYTKQWKNKFVSMLPEIVRRDLHRKYGFATIVEFAAKVGGVGKATVKAVFQLENHIKDKPVLKALIPKVGVAKVRVIATIATKDNQHDLAKKIQNMSKVALEMYAREKRKSNNIVTEEIPGYVRKKMSFGLDEDVEFELRKFKNDMGGDKIEWNDVIKVLLERALVEKESKKPLKKIAGKIVGIVKLKKTQKKTRKKRVKTITRNSFDRKKLSCKCIFPGCNKPAQ